MQHWHIPSITSTRKQAPRDHGAQAPRTASNTPRPQVLFSHPECRAIMVPIEAGGRMNDHVVRERAIVATISGHVTFRTESGEFDCPAGSVVDIEPGERHAVEAHVESRLLLMLAPWRDHAHGATRTPSNATAAPD